MASQTVKTGVGIGAAHKDTIWWYIDVIGYWGMDTVVTQSHHTIQPVTVTPPCVRTKDATKGA